MPERFLLQVLRSLVTHDILRSTRGVEGGYTLQRPADEVTLLEVIEAVEGPLEAGPFEGGEMPPHAQRRLQLALQQVAKLSREHLASVTFAELLRNDDEAKPVVSG